MQQTIKSRPLQELAGQDKTPARRIRDDAVGTSSRRRESWEEETTPHRPYARHEDDRLVYLIRLINSLVFTLYRKCLIAWQLLQML